MNVQIMVNGKELEMYEDDRINFTFQVNDIADVKDRQTNYTNSFNIPRTPTNIRIFEGLGIPCDSSTAPYKRLDCSVKIDGFDFINNGWLHVKETAEDYRCHIYSGIIGFFKSLENKTLADLDLSEAHHIKTSATVAQSHLNPNYRYLIADYNGEAHTISNGQEVVNIDALIPSVSVKYLWDKIFKHISFKSEIDSSFFENLWFTYPRPLFTEEKNALMNIKSFQLASMTSYLPSENYSFFIFDQQEAEKQGVFEARKYTGTLPHNVNYNNKYGCFVVKNSGVYRIEYELRNCYLPYDSLFDSKFFIAKSSSIIDSPKTAVEQHATHIKSLEKDPDYHGYIPKRSRAIGQITLQLNQGDVLTFGAYTKNNSDNFHNCEFNLKIINTTATVTDFAKDFNQITITDFIKEILVRFGLTIFVKGKKVKFKTLSERLNGSKIDWSRKYINRISESYIHNDYAQNNHFKYQYSDKEMTHSDGIIKIENQTLKESKTLFQSKTYAPISKNTPFNIGEGNFTDVPLLQFFEKQIKENNSGMRMEYKPLDKRFHFVHSKTIDKPVSMSSKSLDGGTHTHRLLSNASIVDVERCEWSYLLLKYYEELFRIIDKSRVHTIELDLSYMDVLSLDFEKVYYFDQEHQFYLLNKLSYDSDGSSKGEFIRVLPSNSNASNSGGNGNGAGNIQPQIRIFWSDNNGTEPRSGTDGSLIIGYSIAPPINGNAEFGWHISFNGSGSVGSHSLANPTSIPIQHGNYEVTLYINTDTDSYSSNTLTYTKTNTSCKKFFFRKTDFIADVSYMDCNDEEQLLNATPRPIGDVFYVCAKSILDASGLVDITDYNNQQSC